MKITFLCGSLEPGCDGVGDYTRKLSGELIRQGHDVFIISLSEKKLVRPIEDQQDADGTEINVLRIPSCLIWKKRIHCAAERIQNFDPEWVSLQYVPFAFQEKGLPFKFARNFNSISKGRTCHVMFHELWVGMEFRASLKFKLWGLLQKIFIQNFLKLTKPVVIHTQTELYQEQLMNIGFTAKRLPLFSNIKNVFQSNKFVHPTLISFVIFGTIQRGAPIEEFATEALIYSKQNNVEFTLSFIGRCGAEQTRWAEIWKSKGLKMNVFGPQPEEMISNFLNQSTFGIATTAYALVEKSGSVAAMLHHNLPVICVSKPWQPKGIKQLAPPVGVSEYIRGNFSNLIFGRAIYKSYDVKTVSEILLKDLLITL